MRAVLLGSQNTFFLSLAIQIRTSRTCINVSSTRTLITIFLLTLLAKCSHRSRSFAHFRRTTRVKYDPLIILEAQFLNLAEGKTCAV